MHIHIKAKCKLHCLKSQSHVRIFLYVFYFFAASRLGSVLHLFLELVFTGKRQFVQVFVRWLQRLMSPCYPSSSEITVSGSGKICRHGDKPMSCRLRCGDPRGRWLYFLSLTVMFTRLFLLAVEGGQRVNTISLTLCFCIRRRLIFIYSPNMT